MFWHAGWKYNSQVWKWNWCAWGTNQWEVIRQCWEGIWYIFCWGKGRNAYKKQKIKEISSVAAFLIHWQSQGKQYLLCSDLQVRLFISWKNKILIQTFLDINLRVQISLFSPSEYRMYTVTSSIYSCELFFFYFEFLVKLFLLSIAFRGQST